MIGTLLDILLSPKPRTLPIRLMVFGLGILIAGGVRRSLRLTVSSRTVLVGGTLLAGGYWFTALSMLAQWYNLYAAYLFLMFHGVEGAAAAQFYRKVAYTLHHRSLPGGSRIGSRILHLAALFSVVLAGAGFLVYQLGQTPTQEWHSPINMTYTFVMLGVTSLGVWWRIQPLKKNYAVPTLLGFAACVVGAELYGYASQVTEVLVILAGSLTYLIGFWLAIGIWIARGNWI